MPATRKRQAPAPTPMPSSLEEICEAVRSNPFLLGEWGSAAPPEALLAGVLEEAAVWGAVPPEHALLVQAAAQMLSAVKAGQRGEEVLRQPAVSAWLKTQVGEQATAEAASSSSALTRLRLLAASALPAEVRKRVRHVEAWLAEFAPELRPSGDSLAQAAAALKSWMARLPAGGLPAGSNAGDAEGQAWLQARMAEAYLAGDEALAKDLRTALLALNARR